MQRDGDAFFQVGRVFSMLYHENAGSRGPRNSKQGPPRNSPQFIKGKYQEPIYSSIRRMIVVKQQQGCCWCVYVLISHITSYFNQEAKNIPALSQPTVDKAQPSLGLTEPNMPSFICKAKNPRSRVMYVA